METTCMSCLFWEPNGDEGLCHRYAPRPLVSSTWLDDSPEAFFSSTCHGDWCGDFQLKSQEVAK